jgi:hypothetical protein
MRPLALRDGGRRTDAGTFEYGEVLRSLQLSIEPSNEVFASLDLRDPFLVIRAKDTKSPALANVSVDLS